MRYLTGGEGAMTAHILYILDRFFEDSAQYCVPLGGTEEIATTMVRVYPNPFLGPLPFKWPVPSGQLTNRLTDI
jgi:hypothetical protein